MSNWITGRVTRITHHTDTLFSLHVQAPVLPFTAGQFAKLGLKLTANAHSALILMLMHRTMMTSNFIWSLSATVNPSPQLAALTPGDELLITDEAAGFCA